MCKGLDVLINIIDPPVNVVAVAKHCEVPQSMAREHQLDEFPDPPRTLALAEETCQVPLGCVADEEEETDQDEADAHAHAGVGITENIISRGTQVEDQRHSEQDEEEVNEVYL